MNALTDELQAIEAEVERLEARKRELYRQSVEAPENEKLCKDSLANLLGEPELFRNIEYPISIYGITFTGKLYHARGRDQPGRLVKVRPCAPEFEDKTFLGIYLGDYAQSVGCSRNWKTGVLEVYLVDHNPMMWIPSRGCLVYGHSSFWGRIETVEQLTAISNETIDGLFYVQAMKALMGGSERVEG